MKLGRALLQNGRSPDSSNVFQFSPAPAADNPLSARNTKVGPKEQPVMVVRAARPPATFEECLLSTVSGGSLLCTGAGELQLVDDSRTTYLHPMPTKATVRHALLQPSYARYRRASPVCRTLGSDSNHNEMNDLCLLLANGVPRPKPVGWSTDQLHNHNKCEAAD